MKAKSLIILCATVVLIALVSMLALNGLQIGKYIVEPISGAVSLGLDLRGGIYAVYIAKNPEQEGYNELVEATVGVLRNRLTQQGFTEATVTRQGTDRIRIEIPDVSNPDEILNIIGTPAHLEFIDPDGNVVITGADMKIASPAMGEGNQPVISFELNDSGKKAFAEATAKNIGKPIEIVLDGVTISSPTVNSAIPDGKGVIEGMGTVNEASRVAGLIMSGALPLDIEQDEISSISASLGVEALNSSLMAGLIGFILVLLFMLAVYRLPGLVADLALCVYVLIVVYAVALVPGVQLTLPGIAGILIGIGMAVDANVIIFERFREELAAGRTLEQALDKGFHNALSAIIDSNVTTIIASLVLMYFGTGSIKGFAITLFIGVVCSMLTAVFVSRFLLRQVVRLGLTNVALYSRPLKHRDPVEVGSRKKYTGHFKTFVCVSVAIVLFSLVWTFVDTGVELGIDFTGGSQIVYEMGGDFDQAVAESAIEAQGIAEYQVSKIGAEDPKTGLQIRLKQGQDSNEIRAAIEAAIRETYPEMGTGSISMVGGAASNDLVRNAVTSLLIMFACMLVYIGIRFDLHSGLAALLALMHDVLIMIAFMIVFSHFYKINSPFIAALLMIVGYSINNTIVIFDRIREAQRMSQFMGRPRLEIVEYSVSSTISRTMNTTITTLLTLVPLFVMGVASIKEFTFPILVGMLAGVYSSVLISPQIWGNWMDKGSFDWVKKIFKKD